jgi:hypothetical protein
MNTPAHEQVLMVLDDAAVAAALLDASCALAQLMRRELRLVYVESRAALAAAALPTTQVLARSAQAWAPLAPADVEQGWRAEAARLRTLAERASARHAVAWSMRVMRGALAEAALALQAESDLLLVAGTASRFEAAQRARRPRIVALDDGQPSGHDALRVATQLAQALGARLETRKLATQPPAAAWANDADLLVLPATALATLAPGEPHPPLLLVGSVA